MAWIIFGVVAAVGILAGMWWLAERAPACTCHKPDCGGGCIKR